jgi:hypothetical protein
MACNSLVALPRVCSDGVLAGVEKVYIIAFKDLETYPGTNEVFSATTAGTVVDIAFAGSERFVEIGLLKSTSGLNEVLTKDNTRGTSFFTQTFTVVLSDVTADNHKFIKDVQNQPVAVLYKTRTGKWFVAGLNGQFEISAIEGGTGVAEADLIGYTLTFNGISTTVAPLVLESEVQDFID